MHIEILQIGLLTMQSKLRSKKTLFVDKIVGYGKTMETSVIYL